MIENQISLIYEANQFFGVHRLEIFLKKIESGNLNPILDDPNLKVRDFGSFEKVYISRNKILQFFVFYLNENREIYCISIERKEDNIKAFNVSCNNVNVFSGQSKHDEAKWISVLNVDWQEISRISSLLEI
jgi:hypothetical protein